ncbi:MAG: DUF805 domain-containing protein [Bacteroidota bacterium]
MNWYIKVLRQYADFSGRARRMEYWMFSLFHTLFLCSLFFVEAVVGSTIGFFSFGIGAILYYFGTIIPALAVTVRRLHDVGKSGWWFLISFVPLIGPIWFLILTLTEGEHGPNPWGSDPKRPEESEEDVIDQFGKIHEEEF